MVLGENPKMLLLVPTAGPPLPEAIDRPLGVGEKIFVNGVQDRAVLLQATAGGALVNLLSRAEGCFVQRPEVGSVVKLMRNKQHAIEFDSELVFGELSAEDPPDEPRVAYLVTRSAEKDDVQPQGQASRP